MMLRETGFTFDGRHSAMDMGMQYSEANMGHAAMPPVSRNEYRIAGQSGTVLFDGETYGTLTFSGSLYPIQEPETQQAAQQLIRRVQEWLTGRKKLIFDYEPDRYYMAQLTKQSSWSLKNWFGGELTLTFQAEPFAYATSATRFSASGQDTIAIAAHMATLQPAPAVIRITNTGSEALTGVNVNAGQIVFAGLSLANGEYIDISCEPPIGASLSSGANALPYCAAFSPLLLSQGENDLTVTVTGSSASVEITARGRW